MRRDNGPARYSVEFLPLLEAVVRERPELHVYLLAWKYPFIFAGERERGQNARFAAVANPRIHVVWDGFHPLGGSHHQKIVVADGAVGYCGGLDICKDRWDTPRHRWRDPRRVNPTGEPYSFFHDVQVRVEGEAVQALEKIFARRWRGATGQSLALRPPERPADFSDLPCTVRIGATSVAVSQTLPIGTCGLERPVTEIRALYLRAIEAAEHTVFIENQYFTSRAVFDALLRRIKRGPVEIVIILPPYAQNWKEHLAIGLEQARLLHQLQRAADAHGSPCGVYYPVRTGPSGDPVAIYVHSKVLIVDDRFLTVGSANTSNRSMGLDTECNISVEAEFGRAGAALRRRIRACRVALLSEHLARAPELIEAAVDGRSGLVAYLDRASAPGSSGPLRSLRADGLTRKEWLDTLPEGIAFDPEEPLQAESLFEALWEETGEVVLDTTSPAPAPPARSRRPRAPAGAAVTRLILLLIIPIAGLLAFQLWGDGLKDPQLWVDRLERLRGSLWLVPVFIGAEVVASLVGFPILLMILVGGILFGAAWGTLINLVGAALGATAGYVIGRRLGQDLAERYFGRTVRNAFAQLAHKGLLAVMFVRVVGVLPFTLVNIAAGAMVIPYRHYILGTVLGMLPGSALLSYFADAIAAGAMQPSTLWTPAALGAGVLVLGWLASRAVRRFSPARAKSNVNCGHGAPGGN